MIPSKTFKAIKFATNIAWYCGAIPYRFRRLDNGQHVITSSFIKKRSHIVRTSFAINCCYLLFITFRVINKLAIEDEKTSLDFIVQMGYIFFSYLMPVVLQITTLNNWEETPQFLIRYISFFQRIKDGYMHPGEKGPKCIKFFSAVLIIGFLVNFQNWIIIIKKPNRPQFLTSIFNSPQETPILVRLPFLIIQALIWASTWAQVWTFMFHLYAYTSCLIFTIQELDLHGKDEERKTSRLLREPTTFSKMLRSMHVLHRLWQQNYQAWFCPAHKAVAISVGTLASYGVIKLSGPRSIIMGFIAMLCLLYLWTLFRKFGKLHEMSRKMLENWMYSPMASKNRWMKRFLRSVPLFRIDIGSFYYVQRTTVIAILWTILNNTVTLLLF